MRARAQFFVTVNSTMRVRVRICASRSFYSDGFSRVPDVVAQRYIPHSKARQKLRTFTLVTDLFIDLDQIMIQLPPTK